MNKFQCVARLTKDPTLIFSEGKGMAIVKFGIAINRRFKREGQPDADFLNVTQFGKGAEATANYMTKGSLISLSGSIQTGSYTNKEGNKVYTVDVIADEVNFLDKKGEKSTTSVHDETGIEDEITPIDDGDIPF